MLFKHNNQLKVDLGDLQNEKENLANYLRTHLKIEPAPSREGLTVNPQVTSPQALKQTVNKFIYHRNLNGTHWVSLQKGTVKINRFKHPKKIKENKNPVSPAIITHGW